MTTRNVKEYPVPPTRLPFVNTEIATIEFDGTPHLVSSIWGGSAGGRLYFWEPDSGHHDVRKLPDGIPGAYMLKPASDGRLYIGGGNGDLIRYNPGDDTFDVLVRGELHSIIWGGCVTDRYVVAAASPGDVLVFDWKNGELAKVFNSVDPMSPPARYGHNVTEAPDGRIIVGMNVPVARLIVLDLETMTVEAYHPDCFGDARYTGPMTFLDDDTLLISVGRNHGETQLLRYPGFAPLGSVENGENTLAPHGRGAWMNGAYYTVNPGTHEVLKLAADRSRWTPVHTAWPGDCAIVAPWKNRDLCGITIDGHAVRVNPENGETSRLDVEPWGVLGVHALCAVPQHGFIAGAPFINRRFWMIDLDSGNGRDVGVGQPGGGQINAILWDETTHELLLFSYTTASVMGFNPDKPYDFGVNPRMIASAKDKGQMRPNAAVHDGRHAWMVTNAEYGRHEGALSRIDPQHNEIVVWKGLVPNQNLRSLICDPQRSRVIVGSSIHPDCQSAPPIADHPEVVVFDTQKLEVTARCTMETADACAYVMTVFDNGDVLVSDGQCTYRWDLAENTLTPMESDVPRIIASVVVDKNGNRWVSTEEQIGILELEGLQARVRSRLDGPGAFLQKSGEKLVFARGDSIVTVTVD